MRDCSAFSRFGEDRVLAFNRMREIWQCHDRCAGCTSFDDAINRNCGNGIRHSSIPVRQSRFDLPRREPCRGQAEVQDQTAEEMPPGIWLAVKLDDRASYLHAAAPMLRVLPGLPQTRYFCSSWWRPVLKPGGRNAIWPNSSDFTIAAYRDMLLPLRGRAPRYNTCCSTDIRDIPSTSSPLRGATVTGLRHGGRTNAVGDPFQSIYAGVALVLRAK